MAPALSETFVLANCDTIVDVEFADVVEQHRLAGNAITIIASMKHIVMPYGVCEVSEGGRSKLYGRSPASICSCRPASTSWNRVF